MRLRSCGRRWLWMLRRSRGDDDGLLGLFELSMYSVNRLMDVYNLQCSAVFVSCQRGS